MTAFRPQCRHVYAIVLLLALASIDCRHAPPNLSPVGAAAYNNTRVIKGLDLLRDAAIDGQSQGVLPLDTARRVVMFHRSALLLIKAAGEGWQNVVQLGLNEVTRDLPPREANLLLPYTSMISTLISITEAAR